MACHAETFDTFAPNAVRWISTAEAATTAAVWVIELLGVVFAFGARFTGYFRISHTTHLLQTIVESMKMHLYTLYHKYDYLYRLMTGGY